MSDVLASFGVGGDQLPSQTVEEVVYPKPTPGRVAHIDADFLAYQVSAETRDELDGLVPRKSLEDMQNNARRAAEHFMRLVGATEYRCHVTPSGSTKGGRPEQAVQQEYQSGRKGREKPEFLDTIRAFIGQELNGVVHLDQEADDGMAQANYSVYVDDTTRGRGYDMLRSVIVSKDKDLRMVPGLHWDFDTETVFNVNDRFGDIWIDASKSTKTVKGWGTKFFWAQCLMGDTADSIKGLPAMSGMQFQEIAPSAAYKKLSAQWDGEDEVPEGILKKIRAEQAKTKQVGPVLAYEYLKDVKNDKDAFQVVKEAWIALEKYSGHEFTHWRTGARVTPTQALLGDMLLLWMRRNKNPNDVIDWIKETCA
jgi:hypothetical protein